MSTSSKQILPLFLLVLGAVIFGRVFAGGLQLTVPGAAEQDTSSLSATKMASHHLSALPSFADLAEAVDPAVVSIQAATIEKTPAGGGPASYPFEFFPGPRNRQRQPQQQMPDGDDQEQQPDEFRSDAGGSGFVISPE